MGKIWPKRSLGTLNNACPRDTTNTPRLKALERLLQQQDTNSGYLYTRTLFDPPPQPPRCLRPLHPIPTISTSTDSLVKILTMKSAIFASLVATAAAFAPAKQAATSTSLSAFEDALGAQPPVSTQN